MVTVLASWVLGIKSREEKLEAALLELVKMNIANLRRPDSQFVSCHTFQTGEIPPQYVRAMELLEIPVREKRSITPDVGAT